MPQERENQYPNMTYEEWDNIKASGIPRETLAARVIVANRVPGIPNRPYLKGESDHAPVLQGVATFAGAVYDLLDGLETEPSDVGHNPEIMARVAAVRSMMEEPKL